MKSVRQFTQGTPVEFTNTSSKQVQRANYVQRIDDVYSLVRDQSGRPPRIIRTDRLRAAVTGYPALVA